MTRLVGGLLLTALAWPAAGQASGADQTFRKWARERIETLARSKDAAKRADAARYLGGFEYPEAVAALARALQDPDAGVRTAAASALWKTGKPAASARASLMAALDDTVAEVVVQAAGALDVLGVPEKDLVPARQSVLAAPRASVESRFLAARGLVGHVHPSRLVAPMLAFLREWAAPRSTASDAQRTNTELAGQALAALAGTGDRAIVSTLVEEMHTARQGHLVLLKALAVYDPKPDGWVDLVLGGLRSTEPEVKAEALRQLGQCRTEDEVASWGPAAARLLRDGDPSVRGQALRALAEAKGLAAGHIGAVLAALSDPEASVRSSAARAVGEIGDRTQAVRAAAKTAVAEPGRPALLAAIARDPDGDTRLEAVEALDKLQLEPAQVVSDLVSLAEGAKDPKVRVRAMARLRVRGGEAKEALPALEALARGPAREVAEEASRAVEAIRSGHISSPTLPASPSGAGTRAGAEGPAMAHLRARDLRFEEGDFYRVLGEQDVEGVRAFLDAGMAAAHRFAMGGDSPLRATLRHGACAATARPTRPETKAVVRLLLERGADPNQADENGNTPLMEAASQGCDREVMRALLAAGAKPGTVNRAGLTAFEMGLFFGHDGLEELLAAGYRLTAERARLYRQGYAANPKALALIDKAVAPR